MDIKSEFIDFRGIKSKVRSGKFNILAFTNKHINFVLNILIYITTFTFFYLISKITFVLDYSYLITSVLFLLSIFCGASLSGKFKLTKQDKSGYILKTLYISLFITLTFLIILFYIQDINHITRINILAAAVSGLLIELFYLILLNGNRQNKGSYTKLFKISYRYIFLDGLILTFFCYTGVIQGITPFNDNKTEILLLFLIYLNWIISAAITHKFIPAVVSSNRMNAFELQVKFYFRIIVFTTLSMIFLQVEFSNAVWFIKALAGYSFVSSLVSIILFSHKIKNNSDEANVVFLKAYEMTDPASKNNNRKGNERYQYFESGKDEITYGNSFEFDYLREYGNVFSVLDTILDLKSFNFNKTLILKSEKPEDINPQDSNSLQLFVNLHVLNDQIKLNDYLLNVHNVLTENGVFIGSILPHHYRYRRYLKKYSFYVGNIFYFFDFIWKRVMPKIPITREIYFTFSKEKDRAISIAEGLGRLVYCGFKVLDLVAVDDVVYFAAKKNGSQLTDKKFFYSPIFKMKRVGKNGKLIYVYKLRTMYPYSEFIQDFVYNNNNLDTGGKFKDDFRVPLWGKLFRKLWIDELPMLINWLKRDLKLIGVRPISNHYLSLYTKEHRERRKSFKPGLLPPYYADMPKTIQEIELSEKIYLDAFDKKPIQTDVKYFLKAVNNILIKKKRSA